MCEEKVMPYSGKIKKTDFGVVIPNQSSVKSKYTNITPDILNRYRLHFLGASHKLKGELVEKKMTKKDIKKRDEIADAISTKDMKDRYGDENVKYAIATKIVMDKKKKNKKVLSASYNMDESAAAAIPAIARIGAQTFGKTLTRSAAKALTPGAVFGAGILAIKGGESNFEKLRKMREKVKVQI